MQSRCGSPSRTSRSDARASGMRPPTRPSACASRRPTTPPSSRPGCRSSRPRSRSSARSSSATGRRAATRRPSGRLNPYALRLDEGVWYVVGHDLDRDATRTFRISRVRSRHPVRDAPRARLPAARGVRRGGAPHPGPLADRRGDGHGADRGAGRHRVVGPPHARRRGDRGGRRLRDELREPRAARVLDPASERPRDPARAGGAPRRGRRRAADAPRPSHRSRNRAGARAPRRGPAGRGRAAARRPRRTGALRRPPGAPRAPARRLRRRAGARSSTPTSSRNASRSRGRSSRRRSRSSTSSTSAAGATRSTPRSTRRPVASGWTRSSTATSSASRRS